MRDKIKRYQYVCKIVFSSFCFTAILVSITQSFGSVSAVEGSASTNASVTVSSACSFSRTNGSGEYSKILANNSSVEIVGSTFTTFCNDPGGYAVYAIGYSNNEYGNTDLIYNNEPASAYNIKTNSDTTENDSNNGNGSSWKMKLVPVENNFTPTIENNYSSYNNIPSTYTKVASYNNVTANDSDSTTGSSITTHYQATASSTQPAGTYAGAVKYTMVHPEATPAAYFMQDVADWADELPNPGDTFQAVDRRDGKVYWVARLADGNIWMTQNLDLDIDENTIYTHKDTDLGWTTGDETATWQPAVGHSTIDFTGNTVDGWVDSNTEPYSANPGNTYYYPSTFSDYYDEKYASLQNCQAAGRTDCEHRHTGNYYNWTAAIAVNNSSSFVSSGDAPNSICPAGWKLPSISGNEFGELFFKQGITTNAIGSGKIFTENGPNNLRAKPLYFLLPGYINSRQLTSASSTAFYWISTNYDDTFAYDLWYIEDNIYPRFHYNFSKSIGSSIRCLARTED